jgi:putative transposase
MVMSEKFLNKYRIPSARRPNWDYAWSANYFITICTHQKQHFFGEIVHGAMQLSEIGRIAELEWLKTSDIRPDMNIHLGAFVVMPNHFHAIVTIGENQYNDDRDAKHGVDFKNAFIPQSKNLSSIIRGFKSAVTIQARSNHADFAWQTRFHDHIIRNSESHDTIERYILNNPINWLEDKFHTAQ